MKDRLRLEFLDKIRGLAAVYVMLSHIRQEWDREFIASLPWLLQKWLACLDYGRFAVGIFIVLSGYCLTLPVAKRSDGVLPGGFWPYMRRRARRILPPYYAALALSLLWIAVVPRLIPERELRWGMTLPAFTPGTLISHLFLSSQLQS